MVHVKPSPISKLTVPNHFYTYVHSKPHLLVKVSVLCKVTLEQKVSNSYSWLTVSFKFSGTRRVEDLHPFYRPHVLYIPYHAGLVSISSKFTGRCKAGGSSHRINA